MKKEINEYGEILFIDKYPSNILGVALSINLLVIVGFVFTIYLITYKKTFIMLSVFCLFITFIIIRLLIYISFSIGGSEILKFTETKILLIHRVMFLSKTYEFYIKDIEFFKYNDIRKKIFLFKNQDNLNFWRGEHRGAVQWKYKNMLYSALSTLSKEEAENIVEFYKKSYIMKR